jgi:hypothetical protein
MCIILRKHCNPIKIKDLRHKQKLIKNKKNQKIQLKYNNIFDIATFEKK